MRYGLNLPSYTREFYITILQDLWDIIFYTNGFLCFFFVFIFSQFQMGKYVKIQLQDREALKVS